MDTRAKSMIVELAYTNYRCILRLARQAEYLHCDCCRPYLLNGLQYSGVFDR